MRAVPIARSAVGELLVGYAGDQAGWLFGPAGWVPVPSVDAVLRRGMWTEPGTATLPASFPGEPDEPPTRFGRAARG